MKSTFTLTEAQAQLSRLVRSKETIGISRHGQTEAFLVPRERMEAILETLELMANSAAMKAVDRDRAGRTQYVPLESVGDDDDAG